jgi:ABC-type glycerol-3-phosphate transport system substrate-binding protein
MKNQKTKKITCFILGLGLLLGVSGCGCKTSTTPQYKVSLEVWGALDDSYTYSQIFDKYKKINPQIQRIEYKKINYDTYRKDVVDALAAGQGPDVFLVHNTWLPIFKDKLMPADGTILSEQKYRQDFADVAADDFIDQGKIWASPLSIDSIGLYYNKDYFNAVGITSPPKSWNEFVEDSRKLTEFGRDGEVVRSGVAMGTDSKTNAKNVNRATDILNLLMLQNGTEMLDIYGRIAMDTSKNINGVTISPAQNALEFYTSFSSRGNANYCWNSMNHYSVDAFSEGQAAMMFNYSWQMDVVKKKSPKLNFAVAPVPQFSGSAPVNYANYWAFAVSKNKISSTDPMAPNYSSANVTNDIRAAEAWKLITFLTTKPEGNIQIPSNISGSGQPSSENYDPADEYLKATKKPAARRDLIEKQKTDSEMGIFAAGNLIAKSWKQSEPEAVEVVFDEMIDSVNRGESTALDAVRTATQRIAKISGN